MKQKTLGNCINCKHFAWWDGDYCCTAKMIILQHSPKGDFTEEILKNMKTSDECEDYDKATKPIGLLLL